MAKTGQKFRKYTREEKEEILRKYFDENVPTSVLAREYDMSAKTIRNWVSKQKRGKDIYEDHRKENSGRPPKEENIDYKERYEILKKYQAFLKAQREKK
mgnify:FL=1